VCEVLLLLLLPPALIELGMGGAARADPAACLYCMFTAFLQT
jgi:hypothetical protein